MNGAMEWCEMCHGYHRGGESHLTEGMTITPVPLGTEHCPCCGEVGVIVAGDWPHRECKERAMSRSSVQGHQTQRKNMIILPMIVRRRTGGTPSMNKNTKPPAKFQAWERANERANEKLMNKKLPPILRLQAWVNTWSISQALFLLACVLFCCGLALFAAALL